MLSIQCQCGGRQTLFDSALGQAVACGQCGKSLRPVVAGTPIGDEIEFAALLEIVAGPQRVGEQIFLGGAGPFSFGKLPERAVVLVGPRVSRLHAVLTRTGPDWRIEDQGSTNGLAVNGKHVKQAALHDGDRVQVGDYLLRFTALTTHAAPTPAKAAPTAQTASDELELDLDALATVESPRPAAARVAARLPSVGTGGVGGIECPSCHRVLPAGAKICVACGINAQTGQPLLTAEHGDLNQLYSNTENVIRVLSVVMWFGVLPISSEARGGHKPYAIRTIALVTVIVSFWFLYFSWTGSTSMRSLKQLLLWGGGDRPTPEMIEMGYQQTNNGDYQAYMMRCEQLRAQKVSENDIPSRAYEELTPQQRCFGEFHWWQLFTHAFLHAGFFHLAGNLVFLLVIGSRVNALIGNLGTLILYPILGVAAALVQLTVVTPGHPLAMLGASGAIMGLAGMYLILFPIYKMHTVGWLWFCVVVRIWYQMWDTPGYAILLFYISFDVIDTLLGSNQGVAHWAHMGGFGAGMVVASGLLFSRAVNAKGADLFSVALGRRAWPLIGSPNHWNQIGEGWLQRLDFGPRSAGPPLSPAAAMSVPVREIAPALSSIGNASAPPPRPRLAAHSMAADSERARRAREELIGERAVLVAKWGWPVPLLLLFLVYHYWPEPAFVSTPGAIVKKAPVQSEIRGGQWWRYNGTTLTPLADLTLDSMVLSKAAFQDELTPFSKWDLVVGWGAMSDPGVVGNIRIIQEARGMQISMTQAPDIPMDSLKAEFALIIAIPASDQVLHQIEGLNPRDVVTLHGKLVSVEMSGGRMLVSNLRRGFAFYGTPDVMWIESITPLGNTAPPSAKP